MLRRFIAIFSLHFFLSVGFFAFGHPFNPGFSPNPAASVPALAIDTLLASDALLSPQTLNLSSAHALNDEQPQWPDVLPRLPPGPRLNPLLNAPERHVLTAALAPPLEGPQRPPRGAALLA